MTCGKKLKLVIVYDNEVARPGFESEWGFSCLVEMEGRRLLFDTGGDGELLMRNLKRLHLDPTTIPEVFISHEHWDHLGGIRKFLQVNPEATVYLPGDCPVVGDARQVIRIQGPCSLSENRFSTGVLQGVEQSLVVKTSRGLVVICGCAHPGLAAIVETASTFGKVSALVGGFHACKNFDLLAGLRLVCPCHCSQSRSEMLRLFPDIAVSGGVGRILEFE